MADFRSKSAICRRCKYRFTISHLNERATLPRGMTAFLNQYARRLNEQTKMFYRLRISKAPARFQPAHECIVVDLAHPDNC